MVCPGQWWSPAGVQAEHGPGTQERGLVSTFQCWVKADWMISEISPKQMYSVYLQTAQVMHQKTTVMHKSLELPLCLVLTKAALQLSKPSEDLTVRLPKTPSLKHCIHI